MRRIFSTFSCTISKADSNDDQGAMVNLTYTRLPIDL